MDNRTCKRLVTDRRLPVRSSSRDHDPISDRRVSLSSLGTDMAISLSDLPTRVKQQIVAQVDALDQQRHDDFDQAPYEWEDEYASETRSDGNSIAYRQDPPRRKFSPISCRLALVSKEWADLTRPRLDLHHAVESLVDLVDGPLARYGGFVESVIIDEAGASSGLSECPPTDDVVAKVERLATHHGVQLRPADETERYERVRSVICAVCLHLLPNLVGLDMNMRERPWTGSPDPANRPIDYAWEAAHRLCNSIERVVVSAQSNVVDGMPRNAIRIREFTRLQELHLGLMQPEICLGDQWLADVRSLPCLQTLKAFFDESIDDQAVGQPWTSSLVRLELGGCSKLSHRGLVSLLKMHGNLVSLELALDPFQDNSFDEDGNADYSCWPLLDLVALRNLVVSGKFTGLLLQQLGRSPIRKLELGHATVDLDAIQAFVTEHRATLKRVTFVGPQPFADDAMDSLESLCCKQGVQVVRDCYPVLELESDELAMLEMMTESEDEDHEACVCQMQKLMDARMQNTIRSHPGT
ncbi:hypothetical protein OIV83_006528 [Microbotryomycetes sp. JL201]|nr:hypothetical protein OIV83_006528 [Microbotryomycetes sp. JL201]